MIQYTIGELENILKVKFPESFHKIYDTGAMQWLTRKDDETEISADSFFYNLDWDFNMLKFSEIPETTEYLYKHLDTERLMANDSTVKFINYFIVIQILVFNITRLNIFESINYRTFLNFLSCSKKSVSY